MTCRGGCLTPSLSKDRQGLKKNRLTIDFWSSFLHVGGGLSSDKRWHRKETKVCRYKNGRKVIKAKMFGISHKYLPPPPSLQKKNPKPPDQSPNLKPLQSQDASNHRMHCIRMLMPINMTMALSGQRMDHTTSSFSLTLLLQVLLALAREKIRVKVSLWPEPVQMFQ